MKYNTEDKNILKRGWFWGIIILIVIMIVIAHLRGQSATNNQGQKKSQHESTNAQTVVLKRNNSTAKKTILGSGNFICGVDIPPGRYVINSAGNSGNFTISNNSNLIINAILDPTGQNGVETITTTITKGDKISINGMNQVIFIPAVTKEKDILTAGIWTVGLDIAPGRYVAIPINGSGNFFVNNDSGNVVNTILDSTGQMGEKNYTLNLTEGETIQISGMNEVKFVRK